MRPLFQQYPGLSGRVPFAPLASLPTPVQHLDAFAAAFPVGDAYLKRDDLTAPTYGGNKVRKLEFLLGQARREGVRTLITFGGAGSNHALATALYGRDAGFHVVSMLMPQPNARSVRRNLLMSHLAGADLHLFADKNALKRGVARLTEKILQRDGIGPLIIPPGGSSPMGALGFVNAALELCGQVAAGACPLLERVYVAAGTLGTSIGLALGFALARAPVTVHAVRVTETDLVNEERARGLFRETNALLNAADYTVPILPFPKDRFVLRHEFFGTGYGVYTDADQRAVRIMNDSVQVPLEGVYTGKDFAALIADAEQGRLNEQTVLFWDTYNSRDFSALITSSDYRELPGEFHRYFEENVQDAASA